jgi:hypothetical protein
MHWKKLVIENDEDVEGGDEDIDDYSCTARPSLAIKVCLQSIKLPCVVDYCL